MARDGFVNWKIAPTFLSRAETEGCLKPPPRLHCLNSTNSTVAQIVLAILQWLSPSASAAQRAPMSALHAKCSPTLTCSSRHEISHCICPIQRFYCHTEQQEQIANCRNEVSITSFPSPRSFALLVSLGKLGGTNTISAAIA